jgi:hypothetical protein
MTRQRITILRVFIASTTTDLVSSLVPFILLLAFWIILMKRVRGHPPPGQAAVLEKLDEIRDEIRRLRQAVEESSSRR